MKIDLTRGKPFVIETTYTTWVQYDLEDFEEDGINIDWSKVVDIECKYTLLKITMEDGTVHEMYGNEGEVDYKWPIKLKLFTKEYVPIYSEGEDN